MAFQMVGEDRPHVTLEHTKELAQLGKSGNFQREVRFICTGRGRNELPLHQAGFHTQDTGQSCQGTQESPFWGICSGQ